MSRTPHERQSDNALAARLIRQSQRYAIKEGTRPDVVDTLTSDILRAIRDAVAEETLMEPAAYDVREIAALVGVDIPPLEDEVDDENHE